MAIGEIYVKLSVAYGDDPKMRALARYGADAGLARDLYVQMVCYCKRLLSDGFVPEEQLGLLVYPLDLEHGKQLAKQLVSVELTKEEAGGWQVVAYLKRNGTKEDVERLSEVRAAAGRTGGRVGGKRTGHGSGQANGKQVASGALKQTDPIDRDRDRDNEETSAGTTRKRGTRVPDPFPITPEMVTWARENRPNVDGKLETEKFVNHFSSKVGRDACKLDWVKTWKNWMLNASERKPGSSQPTLPAGVKPGQEHTLRR